MLRSIKMQTKVLFQKKLTITVFFILLGLVIINFFTNLQEFSGEDINTIIHPMQMIFLSGRIERTNVLFFQYYPLLVIIPSAFAYINDKNSKEISFIQSRVGRKNYYWGRFISCFLVSFVLFTSPFIIEAILNCITFPLEAVADVSRNSFFSLEYIEKINGYLFSSLWYLNSYLYVFLFILGFGFMSAVFAVFAMALSTFSFIKFKVLLFVPIYALLYIVANIKDMFSLNYLTYYYRYISMLDDGPKSEWALLVFVLSIMFCNSIILFVNIRKDEII